MKKYRSEVWCTPLSGISMGLTLLSSMVANPCPARKNEIAGFRSFWAHCIIGKQGCRRYNRAIKQGNTPARNQHKEEQSI